MPSSSFVEGCRGSVVVFGCCCRLTAVSLCVQVHACMHVCLCLCLCLDINLHVLTCDVNMIRQIFTNWLKLKFYWNKYSLLFLHMHYVVTHNFNDNTNVGKMLEYS